MSFKDFANIFANLSIRQDLKPDHTWGEPKRIYHEGHVAQIANFLILYRTISIMHTNLVNFKIDFPIIKRGAVVFVQCNWNKLTLGRPLSSFLRVSSILIKACVCYFSLFLKDKCIFLLIWTKYIEKKFNLPLFFLPTVSQTFILSWATTRYPPPWNFLFRKNNYV